ncbi:hypothetical protein GOP47_0030503 [Adiantum capillus-veneris]|nr:hypothetical protein GOP47_0030290 [Adiantum capillus-veneris]KAI5055358.1 hypothetical protein GOP47_0030503 [Adiantum capillus-veneris]
MRHPKSHFVLAFLVTLSFQYLLHGAPIGPPNLKECRNVTTLASCCIPLPKKRARTFSLDSYPLVKRVRSSTYVIDEAYTKKYAKAYELMRGLPSDDPRSLTQQASMHCAMCLGAYFQRGTSAILHVHYSWLFFPWHRWYLYFHERILARLLGDPTFALPFWDWDNQVKGNYIPVFYMDERSALYDAYRDPHHAPPALMPLSGNFDLTNDSMIILENLETMNEQVVATEEAGNFMGGPFRLGDIYPSIDAQREALGGTLDNGAHGMVHRWVGDPSLPDNMDMGSFALTARDPIFYSHHANVDRIWDIWRTSLPGGPRKVFTDPDFLNTSFYFYDENADLVKVKICDCLDNEKLGISYAKVPADKLWVNYRSFGP